MQNQSSVSRSSRDETFDNPACFMAEKCTISYILIAVFCVGTIAVFCFFCKRMCIVCKEQSLARRQAREEIEQERLEQQMLEEEAAAEEAEAEAKRRQQEEEEEKERLAEIARNNRKLYDAYRKERNQPMAPEAGPDRVVVEGDDLASL